MRVHDRTSFLLTSSATMAGQKAMRWGGENLSKSTRKLRNTLAQMSGCRWNFRYSDSFSAEKGEKPWIADQRGDRSATMCQVSPLRTGSTEELAKVAKEGLTLNVGKVADVLIFLSGKYGK